MAGIDPRTTQGLTDYIPASIQTIIDAPKE
jgi:hypothetical protein